MKGTQEEILCMEEVVARIIKHLTAGKTKDKFTRWSGLLLDSLKRTFGFVLK
jgi:hypothetical protein